MNWKDKLITLAFSLIWIGSLVMTFVMTFGLAYLGVNALISVFG